MSTRKVKVMDVTPEIAARWLEKNTHNRSVRQTKVDEYATSMKTGKWLLTHEAIAFVRPWVDKEGNHHPETLQDGQHRLWAVMESGVTCQFTVWFNCEPEEFDVIGQGIGRTQGDVLKITRRDIKHPTVVASVCAAFYRFFCGGNKLQTWQTAHIIDQIGDTIERVVDYKRKLARLCRRELIPALIVADIVDATKAVILVERLHSMIGFTDKDPIRALHVYLSDQAVSTAQDSAEVQLYKCLYAVLAELDGRNCKRLMGAVDSLGTARKLMGAKVEKLVAHICGGRLPRDYYTPRGRTVSVDGHDEQAA